MIATRPAPFPRDRYEALLAYLRPPASRSRTAGKTTQPIAEGIQILDPDLARHMQSSAGYARALCEATVAARPDHCREIVDACRVHDLGKLLVPESVLQKPGALTAEEHEVMRHHATWGADLLTALEVDRSLCTMVQHHHEWWDGRGYPDGLAGEKISLGGRIIAIADAFEAMVSDRPYRAALTPDNAASELRRCAGTQFDPSLVAVFLSRNLASSERQAERSSKGVINASAEGSIAGEGRLDQ